MNTQYNNRVYVLIIIVGVLKLQKEILTLLCENILRSKRCEKMLQNLTEKSTNTNLTSISNIVDNDTDLYPEYLPAKTLADFHLAEDKWKTDKAYRENVVCIYFVEYKKRRLFFNKIYKKWQL